MHEAEHGNTVRTSLWSGGKGSPRMDRRILPMLGLPHYDRLVCNDDDRQAGPMRARKEFKPTTKIFESLRQEQGRQNSFSPKNEITRQRLFDEALRADLEWMSQRWRTYSSQSSSSASSSTIWWQHEHEHQASQWCEHQGESEQSLREH